MLCVVVYGRADPIKNFILHIFRTGEQIGQYDEVCFHGMRVIGKVGEPVDVAFHNNELQSEGQLAGRRIFP
jgi:hypothetical protein